ncbi:hypothetical protein CVT26_015438 [Gymnopilus dilepis]|uniref:Uncharacterized protein n=1 Tax=Gymnopilus dilepis TaxID=231916 RepID=A0A409YEN0_9AGAR|nr:hypothetical protein CVT26_015438 [Gymnopilus dilepis]
MSTPPPPPASEAPRQLIVPLPPELDLEDYEGYYDPDIKFASSSAHLAIGYKNSAWIYSLPAFDLVDTINPGWLARSFGPLQIYERFLIVMCEAEVFEERCFLYIWDLSARKHIGTVKSNASHFDTFASVSLPSTDIPDHGQRSSSGWPQDPLLIVCSDTYVGSAANLATYVLNHPSAEHVEGDNERSQGPQLPMMTIYRIRRIFCLASMGRMALTGGWDNTVRNWDIMTGQCQMVFIGHTATVRLVDLDEERIYSNSYDSTIRVWDRYKGDCLHILEVAVSIAEIFVTPSYIIAAGHDLQVVTTLFIWDIVSGKLQHRVDNQSCCALGPIRGNERTLATIEADEDSSIKWFRIWDLKSGQPLMTSSFEPGLLDRKRVVQGRFVMGIVTEDEGHVLKVWDFGANDAEYGEVRDDDHGNSRDNSIDQTEEVMRDDCGMSVRSSPSSSAAEGALAGNSMVASKRKRSPTPDLFPKRKREKNEEHDEQVSTSLT